MTTAHRMSISTVAFLIGLGSSPVLAQTVNDNTSTASTVAVTAPNTTNPSTTNSSNSYTPTEMDIDRIIDRDLSDQKRIETGLKDGDITNSEDVRLERDKSRIDRMVSKDLSDGTLSPQEVAQIRRAQTAESNQITRFDNNGNKVAAGSVDPRLVSDTQRDIRLDQRIDRGIGDGSLTAAEVAQLEGAQAAKDHESRFGQNGRDGDHDRDGKTKVSLRDMNGPDGDHDRDDIRRDDDYQDHDKNGDHDKGWGHWSWDRPHHGLDRDDLKVNTASNLTANDNDNNNSTAAATTDNVSVSNVTSTSVNATGTASTPANAGSSTDVTASNTGSSTTVASTPVSATAPSAITPPTPPSPSAPVMPVSAPVVTPHVAPPHAAVIVPHK